MTSVDSHPDWNATVVPHAAFAAVIRAAEHAAYGRGDAASVVIAEASASPAWMRTTAVRTLAGLLAGPDAATRFDKLRDDVLLLHLVALLTGFVSFDAVAGGLVVGVAVVGVVQSVVVFGLWRVVSVNAGEVGLAGGPVIA
jgi:hypothetical protein